MFGNCRKLIFAGAVLSAILAADPAAASDAETGSVVVAGLAGEATVRRDSNGIPHISAGSAHDLILLQGWVHARDRLFQMDVLRRQASGTLAEIFGPEALAGDVEFRTVGLRRAAEKSLPILTTQTQEALAAYAEGVNAYVQDHALPPEYGALELARFEPWTAVDSLAIAKLLSFGLSFELDIAPTVDLLTYQAAGDALGFDGTALYFQDTHRSAPFDPAATVPDALAEPGMALAVDAPSALATATEQSPDAGAGTTRDHGLGPAAVALGKGYLRRIENLPAFRDALRPGRRVQGSNAWIVGGDHTLDGQPLLANDPHLALGAPATFYQIHLRAEDDGYDAVGDSLPGAPFVILGHNRDIAWGATTNRLDVTDTFQEQVAPDPGSPSGLSIVHQGRLEPIIPLPQLFAYNQPGNGVLDDTVIAVPGSETAGTFIPPVVLIVPRRNDGPILSLDPASGMALSLQYTGFSGTREADTFRLWNLARDLDDFRDALQYFDVGSQNFMYIDRTGNIAYFTSAEMPLREDLEAGTVAGLPPFFIRNGAGGNEWLPDEDPPPGQAVPYEILPFEEMPQLVNPPADLIVNANNDPAGVTLDNDPLNQLRPGGGLYYLSPRFSFGTRAGRITQALAERLNEGYVTAEDMAAVQADVVMLDAQVFTPYITRAFAHAKSGQADPGLRALARDRGVAEAVKRLDRWDHSAPTGLFEGYDASDIDGERLDPTDAEIANSVAATIYAAWRGRMIGNTLDAVLDAIGLPRPDDELAMTALRHLLDGFDTNQGVGASGLNFFDVPGIADAATRRDLVILQSLAQALELLAGPEFDEAFGGSTDQDDYRWGYLHRLVLAHPLGGPFDIPPAGGAFPAPFADLPGLPVDGGFGTVDAATHSLRAESSNDFMFAHGPVRRYVAEPRSGNKAAFSAENALPGGESGVLGSPYRVNLLGRWLTNDTYPVRQDEKEIAKDTVETVTFAP